jgi:hypothetical protein
MTDIKRNLKAVATKAEKPAEVAVQFGNVESLKLKLLDNINHNLLEILTLLKEKK